MDRLVAQLLSFSSAPPLVTLLFGADLYDIVRRSLGAFSLVLLALILIVLFKLSRLRPETKPLADVAQTLRGAVVSTSRIAKQWEKIRQRLEAPVEAEWKIAVIDADMLVDDLLRRMGYAGSSLGDRLKSISSEQLSSIEAIWAGHKVRNKVVHDPNMTFLHREAREAITNFEVFLKEADVLE